MRVRHVVVCSLSGCTILFRLISQWHDFIFIFFLIVEYKTCFDFFYKISLKYFPFRKNSAGRDQ